MFPKKLLDAYKLHRRKLCYHAKLRGLSDEAPAGKLEPHTMVKLQAVKVKLVGRSSALSSFSLFSLLFSDLGATASWSSKSTKAPQNLDAFSLTLSTQTPPICPTNFFKVVIKLVG